MQRIHLLVLVERHAELANTHQTWCMRSRTPRPDDQPWDVVVGAGQGLQVELVVVLVLGRVDKGRDIAEGLLFLSGYGPGDELGSSLKSNT